MMQQYLELKEKYRDTLLFYRMGDFYEMFFEDAELASRILGITLTSRDKQAENPIPMCGVPYHSAEGYLSKLLDAGHKVAICEQIEDPKKAKGLVKREVIRVLTPGLITNDGNLEEKASNYLAAIYSGKKTSQYGLAYLDITTAEFKVTEVDNEDDLLDELARINPKEILIPRENSEWFKGQNQKVPLGYVNNVDSDYFDYRSCYKRLINHFQVHSLSGFGCQNMKAGVRATGALLSYLEANHQYNSAHLKSLKPYHRHDFMILDDVTLRNLEIFYSSSFQGQKGTLIEILDHTVTAMGGRLLREWIRFPLLNVQSIQERQDALKVLVKEEFLRNQLRDELNHVYDIERLNSKIAMGLATPRDLVSLRSSFTRLPVLFDLLESLPETALLNHLRDNLDLLEDVSELLQKALVDDPPLQYSEGGFIQEGYNPELDKIRSIAWDAKNWMLQYETQQRENTGINSLKVRYNKVFGYFIEVSRSNLSSVPDFYTRKQTLVNAERFITEELKNYETAILESEEKRIELEQKLFHELLERIVPHNERIKRVAKIIAQLDVLCCLAQVAVRNNYFCPEVHCGETITIKEGRHPVVEKYLESESFVPNDIELNNKDQQILIITGPNMAGKSTIIRQVALIVLLAHIGSFVPASSASIGLVDRIFTRVGAMDDLARGRSTFMVEMEETANILRHATSRSLVILDEIGRGTSTFDGLSIAWAVAEYLHNWEKKGIKTLFATHYHELTRLSDSCRRVTNMNVMVKEWRDEIIFLRKLGRGGGNRSYGIQVARLAGIPEEVLQKAKKILHNLEKKRVETSQEVIQTRKSKKRAKAPVGIQLSLFQNSYMENIRKKLIEIEIDDTTPLEALNILSLLQKLVKEQEDPAEKTQM